MEKILDVIPDFLNVLLPVVTLWTGWATGRLREKKEKDAADQKQQAALVDGVKSLLRGQIIDDGLRYLAEGAIPPFALQSMELQYDAYERLGDGDKSVNDIVCRCKGLKIRSGNDHE